jgi:hypothetical protein
VTREHATAPSAGPARAAPPAPAPSAVLPHRLLGNRAVGQLLARGGAVPRALDAGLRTSLEQRFGADLGSVRIHTGPAASALATAYRARALTVGEDVVFRGAGYAPWTEAGRWSIAHEVAHVVQQRRGGPAADEPALESDAEAAARAFVAHPTGPVRVRAASPVRVSRQAEKAEEAEPDDSLGWVDHVIDAVVRQLPLGMAGPMQGVLPAALRGFVAELVRQLSGANRARLLAELRDLDMINFTAGYAAGTLAGLLSPLTDLVGLALLARHLPEKIGEVLARGFAGAGEILADVADIAAGLQKWVGNLKKRFAELDAKAFAELLAHLDKRARKAAASAGHAAARELVKTLTGGGDAAKESWVSGLFVGNRSRERGYNIGHAVGAVTSNVLIFVLTEGVGAAIVQIAGKLGKLGKVAEIVTAVGEVVMAVERAIGAVAGVALKPFQKLLEPLVELLGRLRSVLRRLLGVVEKGPAAAAVTATEAAGKKLLTPPVKPAAKPPAKPAAKPEPKPRPVPKPEPKPEPKAPTPPEPALDPPPRVQPGRAANDNAEVPGGVGKAANDNAEVPGGVGKAANDDFEIGPGPQSPAAPELPVAEVEDIPLKATGSLDASGTPASTPVAMAGASGKGGKSTLKLAPPPPPGPAPQAPAPKASSKSTGKGARSSRPDRTQAPVAYRELDELYERFPGLRRFEVKVLRRGTGPGMHAEGVLTGTPTRRTSFQAVFEGKRIQIDDIDGNGILVDPKAWERTPGEILQARRQARGVGPERDYTRSLDFGLDARSAEVRAQEAFHDVLEERLDDAADQLTRQARFTEAAGLNGVEWRVTDGEWAALLRKAVRNRVPARLRKLITIEIVE